MNAHEKGIEAACDVMVMTDGDGYAWDHVEEAISAYLQASGLVLLPREPTEEMVSLIRALTDSPYGASVWMKLLASFPSPLNTIKQENKENG